MKAVVKTKRQPGVDVLDVPVPPITETDMLVKVRAASLCGSDVHIYEWTPNYEWIRIPVILGHEFSGEVVEAGAKVKTARPGDRITVMPAPPIACSRCDNCQVGRPDLCSNRLSLGLRGDGAFAEYVRLPAAATTFKLPDSLGYEAASLTEPLSVVLYAVDQAEIKVGQSVAILGPGPIGLLALQVARLAGALTVMVTGTRADSNRLATARQLGADETLNVEAEDPVKRAKELTGTRFDVVLESTGSPKSVPQALEMVKAGGKVVLIGIHPAPGEIPTTEVVRHSKSIIGAYGYDPAIWRRAIALLNTGKVKVGPMITHRLSLAEARRGFEMCVSREATKAIFVP